MKSDDFHPKQWGSVGSLYQVLLHRYCSTDIGCKTASGVESSLYERFDVLDVTEP